MSEHKFFVPSTIPDPVTGKLPTVYRVLSITRIPAPKFRNQINEALLFHEKASIRVTWVTARTDVRLRAGSLVSIRWMDQPISYKGAIRINHLVLLERAEPNLNPFDTIPSRWVKDRTLIDRGHRLWEAMSEPFQHLFNAVLWDAERCHHFMTGPSSISGPHNDWNGNLRQTIETAEQVIGLSGEDAQTRSVRLAAALLHDIGKADEYRYDHTLRTFTRSDRGALVGHRQTMLKWIASARENNRILLPEAHYLALLHALTSPKGSGWIGSRALASLESSISTSDLYSASDQPHSAGPIRAVSHVPKEHPHLILDSEFSHGSVD